MTRSKAYVDLLDGYVPLSDTLSLICANVTSATRNSANLTPVNGWAGQGLDTPNTHQLWKFVRA